MNTPLKSIALLGGSFDPPHNGHASIIKEALLNPAFEEIWLVPVYHHPFEKPLADFTHRLNMLLLLKAHLNSERLIVCEIEKKLNLEHSYFYHTLLALKNENPSKRFTILLGSDLKSTLSKWHKIDLVQKMADFYFIPRKGYEDSPHPEISSTQIRHQMTQDQTLGDETLPSVKDYIAKHKLYS